MSYTVDDTTQASAPGGLSISAKKYLDYNGVTGFRKVAYTLLLTLPPTVLFRFFRRDKLVYAWIEKVEHFQGGCVNPAVVLDVKNGLIATFTDLKARDEDPVPVVKISEEKLWLVKNENLYNGKRIAAVALYFNKTNEAYPAAWSDFDPRVPACFTDDAVACRALVNGISDSAWTCLELGLAQIPVQNKVGLFKVDLDKNLVKDA